MLNNFIYAQTKDLFLEKLDAGEVLEEAIVLIADTKEIWNRGTYFGVTDLSNYFTIDEIAEIYATIELVNNKQDRLVSGTNIKTINGQSLLGGGDITISGGSSSGGSGAYSEVNHGTADTTFTLTPNTFHVWDEVASLTLDFGTETIGVANEYLFQFTSGSTATSLTLPDDIKWANDSAPTIAENMIYQVSVLKGLASVLEFSNITIFSFEVEAITSVKKSYQAESGMTWDRFINSAYNTIENDVAAFSIESNKIYHNGLMLMTPEGDFVGLYDLVLPQTYITGY